MQSSGLIFLVLIAIWAAYLLQHWVRRREHLATARSVDRFSLAMRVLQRRTPLPEPNLSAPRSYAMSPARPPRPEVVVKRAQSVKPDVQVGREGSVTDAAVRPTRVFHVLAGMSARRVRGLSFLASLSLALAVSALAAFSVLLWWSVPVAFVILVADVVWLRHCAVSERSERAIDRTDTEPLGFVAGPGDQEPRGVTYFEAESETDRRDEAEVVADPEADRVVSAPVADGVQIAEPTESASNADQSGWAPVPVPPPTYTLKAKAADPMVAAPAPTPAPRREVEVGGPWSLDGMVYDCELDELVERRSATGA